LIGYDPGMSQLFLVAVAAAGSTVFPVEALHWTRGEEGTRSAALWGDLEMGPGAIMLDWPPGLREGRHRHASDLSIAMIAGNSSRRNSASACGKRMCSARSETGRRSGCGA
jgi:hypothetical protein